MLRDWEGYIQSADIHPQIWERLVCALEMRVSAAVKCPQETKHWVLKQPSAFGSAHQVSWMGFSSGQIVPRKCHGKLVAETRRCL